MRFPKLGPNAGMCLLGAFVFALFGLFVLPWTIWNRGQVEAMMTWPMAEAEVVAADTTSTYRRGAGPRYQHRLNYRFLVDNQAYLGDRATYGGSPTEWHLEAEAKKSLPAIGSRIQIRFNPEDPSDNVVRVLRSPESKDLVLSWIAGAMGFGGIILMLAGGRAWRSERMQGSGQTRK